jgi:predicted nucleotidyltransferase
MIQRKIVQKFGNSGHIVLPKEYIGRKIKIIAEPKTFEEIKSEILKILRPYLENIIGVYLYGSYARNEQTINSDIDILVITTAKLKIIDRINDFAIVSVTIAELEEVLKNNAILILPIIKEAKAIINAGLLKKYKEYKFTKENSEKFIDSTRRILEINKKGLKLDFEIGSLVYSLILRIRALLMIKLILNNKIYSKSALFHYLRDSRFSKNKVEEMYRIYSNERNNVEVRESNIIKKEDIKGLLAIAEELLKEVKL